MNAEEQNLVTKIIQLNSKGGDHSCFIRAIGNVRYLGFKIIAETQTDIIGITQDERYEAKKENRAVITARIMKDDIQEVFTPNEIH